MRVDLTQPITRREALAAGLTVTELAGPRFRRLFHGLYLPAHVELTVLQRARAALKISPEGSFASHHTAAAIWGGWVPQTSETHISVVSDLLRSKRRGIKAHRARSTSRAVPHRDILLSPAAQTFVELAASGASLVELVVLGDSLVKAGRFTPAELVEASKAWLGAGVILARRAALLVREGVDSATESRLRMLIVLAGLPEPKVNLIVRTSEGSWSRRFDLSYPNLKLIIEYDGRHHAESAEQWSNDILRREELEAQGWRIIVINADALFNHPTLTLQRIRSALEDRTSTRLPRRVAPEWYRQFADRPAVA